MAARKTKWRVGLAWAACALAALGWGTASLVSSPTPVVAMGGKPEIRYLYFPNGCAAPYQLKVGWWEVTGVRLLSVPIRAGDCLMSTPTLANAQFACCASAGPDSDLVWCVAADTAGTTGYTEANCQRKLNFQGTVIP